MITATKPTDDIKRPESDSDVGFSSLRFPHSSQLSLSVPSILATANEEMSKIFKPADYQRNWSTVVVEGVEQFINANDQLTTAKAKVWAGVKTGLITFVALTAILGTGGLFLIPLVGLYNEWKRKEAHTNKLLELNQYHALASPILTKAYNERDASVEKADDLAKRLKKLEGQLQNSNTQREAINSLKARVKTLNEQLAKKGKNVLALKAKLDQVTKDHKALATLAFNAQKQKPTIIKKKINHVSSEANGNNSSASVKNPPLTESKERTDVKREDADTLKGEEVGSFDEEYIS